MRKANEGAFLVKRLTHEKTHVTLALKRTVRLPQTLEKD